MARPRVSTDALYEIATYLAKPETEAEIHAELAHGSRIGFEDEYEVITEGYPLPTPGKQGPYYVWPPGTNKWGSQLRIYFKRFPPEPPPIQKLYTDFGKWYAKQGHYRINHSNLVKQLLECGFVLGTPQDPVRIAKFMRQRFPVRP